jgi:hypothetical protein
MSGKADSVILLKTPIFSNIVKTHSPVTKKRRSKIPVEGLLRYGQGDLIPQKFEFFGPRGFFSRIILSDATPGKGPRCAKFLCRIWYLCWNLTIMGRAPKSRGTGIGGHRAYQFATTFLEASYNSASDYFRELVIHCHNYSRVPFAG